jgi:sugar phosphate isomerase/epimerase
MNEPIIAVSSWAVHPSLGAPPFWGVGGKPTDSADLREKLLTLPSQLRARGIGTMELCHFHLPSLDENFLHELRDALTQNDVTLHALLIDDGDLTGDHAVEHCHWILEWLPVAAALGAKKTRIIAGKTPSEVFVAKSTFSLRVLAREFGGAAVQVTTENWFALDTPSAVLHLLENCDGQVGLNLDFGNWSGEDKYERLAAIAPHAGSCHAKADFNADGAVQADDFARCLNLPYPTDFRGPFTLVAGDWPGVETTRDFIQSHFA